MATFKNICISVVSRKSACEWRTPGIPINIIILYSVLQLVPGFSCRQALGQWCIVDQQWIHFRVPVQMYLVYVYGRRQLECDNVLVLVCDSILIFDWFCFDIRLWLYFFQNESHNREVWDSLTTADGICGVFSHAGSPIQIT